MIKDVTGIELIPGKDGVDCPGNGKHTDENGDFLECCCDECNYLICCFFNPNETFCRTCKDPYCPHVNSISASNKGFSQYFPNK